PVRCRGASSPGRRLVVSQRYGFFRSEDRRHGRDVLDRELDVGQFGGPAVLEVLDGVQDEVVEPFAAAAIGGDLRREEDTTQAAPAPVTAP
ncbi:hypothetical protein, partial [Frankia sp. Cas3]|uniref:hypothetical protein n=1 Tax=Frankia sp. Cas3 TaxID=3073926 RepID=UPI002AD58533